MQGYTPPHDAGRRTRTRHLASVFESPSLWALGYSSRSLLVTIPSVLLHLPFSCSQWPCSNQRIASICLPSLSISRLAALPTCLATGGPATTRVKLPYTTLCPKTGRVFQQLRQDPAARLRVCSFSTLARVLERIRTRVRSSCPLRATASRRRSAPRHHLANMASLSRPLLRDLG